ncbi:MAG: tyrosine-type recombinase/integrase [Acidobacteriales bacterium]|nr:tyrosine-type recombinase/integrase [Terriglobales bacterium]
MKPRVQHPKVHEPTDRGGSYWYFRYWADVPQADNTLRSVRRFQIVGPSQGSNRLSKRQAEVERDKFLATINIPSAQQKLADGMALFSRVAEEYKRLHVLGKVGDHFLLAAPTRQKYLIHLEQRIEPMWGGYRLGEIRTPEVEAWLNLSCNSWHLRNDVRGILSGVFTKAQDWGYWAEGKRNPIHGVAIGEKWNIRPERILSEEETVRVLRHLRDPNLLILETALATGARISEILGLTWANVNLAGGFVEIAQRCWRGDIARPKSRRSRRVLALGHLVERYAAKAASEHPPPEQCVFGRSDGSGLPVWDSGVRQALKRAAALEGCDFPGLGPHSFRRANITWRQEVGGSSIEVSRIAGHSTVRMTEEYTKVQLGRQAQLTELIQDRLARTAEKQDLSLLELIAEAGQD